MHHEREASRLIGAMQSGRIDPKYWGHSTIRWWPEVAAQYPDEFPKVTSTQPLYRAFRRAVIVDLAESERL